MITNMHKLIAAVALLVLVCTANAGSFSSYTGPNESHYGTVDVPTAAFLCWQWAGASGSGSYTVSIGPKGTYYLSGNDEQLVSISEYGPIPAGSYYYYQQVAAAGYSNLMIGW